MSGWYKSKLREWERTLRRIGKRNQTFRLLAHQVLGKRQAAHVAILELRTRLAMRLVGSGIEVQTTGIDPANLVWIFCYGRSGSTWLRNMMAEMQGYIAWDEPRVGKLFGDFYFNETVSTVDLSRADFIMADATRQGWLRSIRNFVLSGAKYSNPGYTQGHYLIIKEAGGVSGAPLLVEALPESRVVLLLRDPRDVIASVMDGVGKGGWLHEYRNRWSIWQHDSLAEENPDLYVENQARQYVFEVGKAKEAYDAHKGPKIAIRYEDLRFNTLGTMKRVYSALNLSVDEQSLESIVRAHSWENIPKKDKGPGKFTRKAQPGAWEKDLTREQVTTIEQITAPIINTFYTGAR